MNTNWLSIYIYNQFCSDPDEKDKKFSETFTNMMDDFKSGQDP